MVGLGLDDHGVSVKFNGTTFFVINILSSLNNRVEREEERERE